MTNPVRFRIFESPDSACARAAEEVSQLIRERAILGRTMVLGLSAGDTLVPFFKQIVYLHREEGLSLKNVITFNSDEYMGLASDHPGSLYSFMRRHLFDHVDLKPENIHFLSGSLELREIPSHCFKYDATIRRWGGLDYQLLGLRQNGCLGFHSPCDPNNGRTQVTPIHDLIRERKADGFGGIHNVPSHVLSLGRQTILNSRMIIMFAWGTRKAHIVRRAMKGRVTPAFSSTYLQAHPATRFFLDAGAGRIVAKVR